MERCGIEWEGLEEMDGGIRKGWVKFKDAKGGCDEPPGTHFLARVSVDRSRRLGARGVRLEVD